jgi:hypothetical protein
VVTPRKPSPTRLFLVEIAVRSPRPRNRRIVMSIVVRFHPTGMTSQQDEEADRRLREAEVWPPDGMDYHVCFGQDGDLRVSEIWDSREKLEDVR